MSAVRRHLVGVGICAAVFAGCAWGEAYSVARNVVVGDQTVAGVGPSTPLRWTVLDWQERDGTSLDNRDVTARAEGAYERLTEGNR